MHCCTWYYKSGLTVKLSTANIIFLKMHDIAKYKLHFVIQRSLCKSN